MHEEIISKASKIIEEKINSHNIAFCTLALIDVDGYPTTSTLTISKSDGINWLTICTDSTSKLQRINHCNKASVCINSEDYHISLVGTIQQLTDPSIKKEMWFQGLENHFKGYDDPNYCVLKFTTERYTLLVDWKEAKGRLQI